MARVYGHGDRGQFLEIGCVPDATFITEITALIAAGTEVIGKLVQFTYSNNYEVTSPAGAAIPDGEITAYEKRASSYALTVKVFHVTDQNSANWKPTCIKQLTYDGTIALQDSIIVDGTTYIAVEDGGTGGYGCVISKDTSLVTVDVFF